MSQLIIFILLVGFQSNVNIDDVIDDVSKGMHLTKEFLCSKLVMILKIILLIFLVRQIKLMLKKIFYFNLTV